MYRSVSVRKWMTFLSSDIVEKANNIVNIESAPYPNAIAIRIAATETFVYGTRHLIWSLSRNSNTVQLTLRYLNMLSATTNASYILPVWLRRKLDVNDVQRHTVNDIELINISSHYYRSLSDSNIILHPSMLFGIRRWWEDSGMHYLRLVPITIYDIPDIIANFRVANQVHNDHIMIKYMKKILEQYYPQIHKTLISATNIRTIVTHMFYPSTWRLLRDLAVDEKHRWLWTYMYC